MIHNLSEICSVIQKIDPLSLVTPCVTPSATSSVTSRGFTVNYFYRGKFATVYQCEKHTSKELFAAKIIQTKSQKNMEESLNEVSFYSS